MKSKPAPVKPVSNGPFSFDSDGFNVDGIPRIGGPSLYEMLFPHEISGIRAQKRARGRAEDTITFPWLVAHLTFYDIEFDPNDTVAELTELLAVNVKHGKCNKLPTRIRAIASELEQLFKVANPEDPQAPPEKGKPAHTTGPQRPVDPLLQEKLREALKKFRTPVDLANHNCSLFLARYFLDQEGKPDPSKTPFPILLPGLSDRLALQQAADLVPGLKTSTGGEGEFRFLVIGWNRAAIFAVTEKIATDQARLRDDIDTTWQEYLRKHYSLIKALPVSSKARNLSIESALGTYAIECRGPMDNYHHGPGDSSLRITYSETDGWTGIFKIGVIYGVMRLDTDRKALLARCKATEKNEAHEDDYKGNCAELEELEKPKEKEDVSEEEDVFSDLSTDERDVEIEVTSFEDGGTVSRKRRKTAQNTPVERSKPSQATAQNRLYFKWRGREHAGEHVAYDWRKKHVGYLHFTDASFSKFDSTISNALIGKNVRFQGFKISNDGGAVTRTYRDSSARAVNISFCE